MNSCVLTHGTWPVCENDKPMARIYVASSWRNTKQQEIVHLLREYGHDVYDFTKPNDRTMSNVWEDIHLNHDLCTSDQYIEAISDSTVIKRFEDHVNAMMAADTCILLLPCGSSAHSEAGFMAGLGKMVFVLNTETELKPELMYRLFHGYTSNILDLLTWMDEPAPHPQDQDP